MEAIAEPFRRRLAAGWRRPPAPDDVLVHRQHRGGGDAVRQRPVVVLPGAGIGEVPGASIGEVPVIGDLRRFAVGDGVQRIAIDEGDVEIAIQSVGARGAGQRVIAPMAEEAVGAAAAEKRMATVSPMMLDTSIAPAATEALSARWVPR